MNVPPQLSSLGRMNTLASWAEPLAQALLQESLPRRWAHVQGVAARARSLAPVLGADADLLEAAAWLHDIGYAPDLSVTGLHALDGGRYLRDAQHAEAMLCRLVAHHSCAIIEAGERGLADALGMEFEPAPQALSSALTYCDMTTSPDGDVDGTIGLPSLTGSSLRPGDTVIPRATAMIVRAVDCRSNTTAGSVDWRQLGPMASWLMVSTWPAEWPPQAVR